VRVHLASLVEDFRLHAHETAVVEHRGNRRYHTTYGELAELAGRFAAELEARKIQPGDRVVLWGQNSATWIAVFFGCLLRGAVVVPLDAAGTSDFARRVVQDVSPALIAGDLPLLKTLTGGAPKMALATLAAALPAAPLLTVSDAVGGHTAFQIVFTSGTTSEPKGIVHTHRNVLASLQPIENEIARYRRYERWVHPLRFLHSLPLSHVFGQFMGLWIPAVLAAELHFSDQLEPARVTSLIRHERISVLIAVPRVLGLLRAYLLERFPSLAQDLEKAKGIPAWKRWWRFRSVHRALGFKFWALISGGATLAAELEGFWNGLGFALIQGYGMTETAALVTLNHPFRIGRGTIGKALPGREVRLSEEGEILVRGDMLAGATWSRGRLQPREGEWLATGDLATQDASGELRFLGRKGDVIVTSAGMNIHPADLEEALARQPGVRGCVVVGCRRGEGGEPVAAVLFSGSEMELQAAVSRANQSLAAYQQIRRVLRWPELQFPFTATGKLLRRKVADWVCGALGDGETDPGVSVASDPLLSAIAEITGEQQTYSGSTDSLRLSEDLKLDSLGRVQLQSLLEQRLGLEIDDDAIAGLQTLGELRALGELPSPGEAEESVPPAESDTLRRADRARAVARTPRDEPIYPHWPWSWPVQMVRVVFLEAIARPLTWLLAAPRVVYTTSPSAAAWPEGPLLVIANHVTAYDGALVLYALPGRLRRRVAAAMSGEMLLDFRRHRNQQSALRNLFAPVAYLLITALFNVFPLPRLRGFRRSFAHAGEAMDRGYNVLLFPEGTRNRTSSLQPFRPGIGLLAAESRVPVLPVALVGLQAMRGGRWFRTGKLEIRVGEPIAFEEGTDPAALTTKLETALRAVLDRSAVKD